MSTASHVASLTKGMEHMRPYVSVDPSSTPKPVDSSKSIYGVPDGIVNPVPRPPHRSHSPSNNQKRSDPFQFGSRYLEEGDNIYEFNAWDHVEVDEAFKDFAEEQYRRQREVPVSDFDKKRITSDPAKPWNIFYNNNSVNFFKNRKWLFQEFPCLKAATAEPTLTSPIDARSSLQEHARPNTIVELGAGAGNTAFPLLAANKNPSLFIHALDFSPKAVDLIRSHTEYDQKYIQADTWDVASAALPSSIAPGSIDIVILVFIFSALAPAQWDQALSNIHKMLKPGGEVLFRDYGKGDLAQVRFKSGRWLEEGFYARGDGTRVYFFEQDELGRLWSGQDLQTQDQGDKDSAESQEAADEAERQRKPTGPHFEVVDLGTDRRMLVNRKRQLKMYRCWLQGRFRKPLNP
ncbi:MAG: hypothetical protein M1828_003755 [Chrysothrix sp. TS-e1954]|nr:MAG: hypothetical protein M1828_003755 [Chrysothrix sp. TS-e1954]